jgi:Rod binding domain-containing protein
MVSLIEGLGFDSLCGLKNAPVEKVAESFEAVFISELVRSMRESLCKDFGVRSGLGMDNYLALMDQALAEAVARAGGIGIKEQVMKWAQSASREKNSSDSEVSNAPGAVRPGGFPKGLDPMDR